MADLLKTGSDWLAGKTAAFMGRTVAYSRGAYSVDVTATKGESVFEEADAESGNVLRTESQDWIISADALTLPTLGLVSPVAGDRIRETIGSTTYVYAVASPPGIPPFRVRGTERATLRIHSKLIGTE